MAILFTKLILLNYYSNMYFRIRIHFIIHLYINIYTVRNCLMLIMWLLSSLTQVKLFWYLKYKLTWYPKYFYLLILKPFIFYWFPMSFNVTRFVFNNQVFPLVSRCSKNPWNTKISYTVTATISSCFLQWKWFSYRKNP